MNFTMYRYICILLGWLRDVSGGLRVPFTVMGVIQICGGLIIMLNSCYMVYRQQTLTSSHKEETVNSGSDNAVVGRSDEAYQNVTAL